MKRDLFGALAVLCVSLVMVSSAVAGQLRAGAARVDVSPPTFPVLINGGMTSRSATGVTTPVYARAVVLDDGQRRVAIVVVDSCMVPRQLLDDAKELASRRTEIPRDRILISATHTHTAPAAMGCLGTNADPEYVPYLRIKLAEAIAAAEANLEPAQVGWASCEAPHYTAVRRWIRRPDRIEEDPFGNPTVRANMHAARNLDDVIGESGPEDPQLSLISLQAQDGRPIAVLANFSMHYFGGLPAVSSDYFGIFNAGIERRIATDKSEDRPPPVGIMSHGCSGDIWRKDYTGQTPAEFDALTIEEYSEGLVDLAVEAYESIEHRDDATVEMAETRLPLRYRVPDRQRLEWAQRIVDELGDRLPQTQAEIYAREQVYLSEWQATEVVVQALRIGDIAIATTPTETYALTGMKIKLQSPTERTMVIELANGGDGYIPPPEQHVLGGYNTWAARSAGLEVQAEPKVVEAAIQLLERVHQRPRRLYEQYRGPAALRLLEAEPIAYWRLDEFGGPRAIDISGNHRDAIYEPGLAYFLEGPEPAGFCGTEELNRAAHFAGGRLRARLDELGEDYTLSLWIWNGMPSDARPIAGWFFSRGTDGGLAAAGEQLGLAGAGEDAGKLVFEGGTQGRITGRTAVPRWTWAHVVLVRDGERVRVYLNGEAEPEITTTVPPPPPSGAREIFIGGRSDNASNWEGRIDEVAVYERALDPAQLVAAAAKQQ